jgi:hypothetical protein
MKMAVLLTGEKKLPGRLNQATHKSYQAKQNTRSGTGFEIVTSELSIIDSYLLS